MPITKEHLLDIVEAAKSYQLIGQQAAHMLTGIADQLTTGVLSPEGAVEAIEFVVLTIRAGAGSADKVISLEEQRLRLTWSASERAKRYKQRLREGQVINRATIDAMIRGTMPQASPQKAEPLHKGWKKGGIEILDYSTGANDDGTPVEDITGFDLEI